MFESHARFAPADKARAFDIMFGSSWRRQATPHRLIWSLFPNSPDNRRGFIFDVIDDRPFTAILRSATPPTDPHGLWEIKTIPLRTNANENSVLRFRVKAVASVSEPSGHGKRGRRRDPAKLLLERGLRSGSPSYRDIAQLAELAGLDWLERQGNGKGRLPTREGPPHGFELIREECWLDRSFPDYALTGNGHRAVFTVYDMRGLLRVTDPPRFNRMLAVGIGRGKAFGYGLMHIRPDDGLRRS